jgi:hypothetical protein
MIASLARATIALSRSEKTRLAELELLLKDAFYRAGQALKEIRDSRLYRDEYATFEDYCRDKWDIARNYANKVIAASEVVKNLSTTGTHTPSSERQARPFTSLPPDQQIDAWQEVVNTAQGRITTALCEKVAKKYKKLNINCTQPEPISQNLAENNLSITAREVQKFAERYKKPVTNNIQADPISRKDLVWFLQEQSMALADCKKKQAYNRACLEDLWFKLDNVPETLEVSKIKLQLEILFHRNEIMGNQIKLEEINLSNNPWGIAV